MITLMTIILQVVTVKYHGEKKYHKYHGKGLVIPVLPVIPVIPCICYNSKHIWSKIRRILKGEAHLKAEIPMNNRDESGK